MSKLPMNLTLNPKQGLFLGMLQAIRLFLAGRGSGKSFTMAVSIIFKMIRMPRSKGAIAAATYNQLLTKIMDSLKEAWNMMGFKEDIHYVIGKQPPKHFKRPIKSPEKWTNTITFYWGSCAEFISLDKPDLVRGGSFDWMEIDEAALLDKTDWTRILLPTLRGNKEIFKSILHYQASFYTSIPWKPSGYWILELEEKAKVNKKRYGFVEANAYDNIEILTQERIDIMREEMDFLEFQIEVMNMRIKKGKNAFYGKFEPNQHTYTPQYIYTEVENGYKSESLDIDKDAFLEISFDFGKFNCCTVWQQKGKHERCLREYYKKGSNTLVDLVNEICKDLGSQRAKFVRIWGEPRGHNAEAASPSMYDVLETHFQLNGWKTKVVTPKGYRTDKHEPRGEMLNDMLEGTRKDLPTVSFNSESCKNTIIVMQTTEKDEKGKKDKRKEKNESFPQEHAPHFSDTVDYYLFFKYGLLNGSIQEERAGSFDVLG
jgi:hypothetical protein